MAGVHPNPGYGGIEHGLIKSSNKPELLSSAYYRDDTRLDCDAIDQLAGIKSWSKNVWSRPDTSDTTYRFQYPDKKLLERTRSAPTEVLRKNKPHPKQVFLTNRLHYVPGYHNADSTLGKPHYQTDASCGPDELSYRNDLKAKFAPEISTAALRQYVPSNSDDDFTKWNRALPPNDSWMATSSNGAKGNSLGIAKSLDEAISDAARDHAAEVASNNRYLRLAGADERARIQRTLDPHRNMDKVPNMMVPHQISGSTGSRRQKDRSNFEASPNKPLYRFPRPRGDFLIHPVWPPTIWHHRIPGFRATPPARGHLSAYDAHQLTRMDGVY